MPYFFLFLGILPSFAWLVFFLKEDTHPEPKKMIARAFIGGVFAAVFAVGFQLVLKNLFQSFQIDDYHPLSFFSFGFVEEILKFLAAYLIIRKSRFFDEPIDAMIYMITVALGFAMLENIAIMSNMNALSEALSVITLRFVGATLLHALSSGLVGYYWAKAIILSRGLKPQTEPPFRLYGLQSRVLIFKGIVFATLLHTIFNYLILISKDIAIYPLILLTIAALFVFWDFEKIKQT